MRPPLGGSALPTPARKQSFTNTGSDVTTPTNFQAMTNAAPTTFFLATDSTMGESDSIDGMAEQPRSTDSVMEGSHSTDSTTEGSCSHTTPSSDSTFGVRSLEEAIDGSDAEDEEAESETRNAMPNNRRRLTIRPRQQIQEFSVLGSSENISLVDKPDSSPTRPPEIPQHSETASRPLTPVSLASLEVGSSSASSPKSNSTRSFQHSEGDSVDERIRTVISGGEEDVDMSAEPKGSAPQLIMPSIMMPRRRPFTDEGRSMGRLKLLVAGAAGVGKTSFVRSIVHICEDIVHVDPLSSSVPSLETLMPRRSKSAFRSIQSSSTDRITEIFASTKAYPSWWSELEETKLLRKRKSIGETVLERNLCFVDTPGLALNSSTADGTDSILQYIETQMRKATSASDMSDSDLLGLMSGKGGPQVDVVFYLLQNHLKQADLEFLKRLSRMTNIVPLIAKSDLLPIADVQSLKESISHALSAAGLQPFTFPSTQGTSSPPYTICSSISNDEDNMDASLLMSPDYVQPLVSSELTHLIQQTFNKDFIPWLKHSTAKKILQWREAPDVPLTVTSLPASPLAIHSDRAIGSPVMISSTSSFSLMTPGAAYSPGSPWSYTQALVADHRQREEQLAQVHLANWAGNLQRSLQNERARYESLTRRDRSLWLTKRLEECIAEESSAQNQEMALVPTSHDRDQPKGKRVASFPLRSSSSDPLGLMSWNEEMRGRGWIALQVLGSVGALGAFTIWVMRSWGGSTGWMWNWWWGPDHPQ